MEWVAVAPATLILALGAGLARAFRRAGWLFPGVIAACLGFIVFIVYFAEVVREMLHV
jgi:hypothetical protein